MFYKCSKLLGPILKFARTQYNLFVVLILFISATLFAHVVFSQNSIPVELTEEEKTWIQNHPKVRATNGLDFAPFDFVQFGESTGFSIDYLNLVAKKTGLNIEYVNGYIWADLLRMVADKKIDITHTLVQSEERDKFLNYTDPYIKLPLVFYGRNNEPLINDADDLIGKKIGIIKGTKRSEIYTSNYPNLELVEYTSTPNALIGLNSGEIDIFQSQSTVVEYLISKNLIFGLKIIGSKIMGDASTTEDFRLAANKENPVLINILKKGMAAITEREYLAIAEKWHTEYLLGNELRLTEDERIWLAENKVVNIAADPTAFPIVMIDEKNEVRGVAGNFLDVIGEKLNLKFNWIGNQNFSEGMDKIKSGEADMLAAVARTADREIFLDFTDEYLIFSYVIYAREGSGMYANMDALKGKKLVQIKDFVMTERIRNDYPDLEIIEVNTTPEALLLLSNGDVDAHVASIPSTSHHIASLGIQNVNVVGDTPYNSHVSFGIRSDKSELSSVIQKAMNSITDEERVEINRKSLSFTIQNESDYTLLIEVIIVATIIVIIILIWAISLRREVKRREIIEIELKTARKEADKANMAKSTFLANMSHEIRAPLNAIIGFSEAITSGALGDVNNEKHKEYLNDIKNNGEHLSSVLKDILDLSKIEAGKWQIEESDFDLKECIDSVIKIARNMPSDKNINISVICEQPIIINADLYAIKRAVINLLSSAIKFTGNGGEIKCLINKQSDGTVMINIKDNGIGISPEALELVLTPFGQNHEVFSNNEAGTGLGLSIVKQLIELHGGNFILESELEVGTTATIILPSNRIITHFSPE